MRKKILTGCTRLAILFFCITWSLFLPNAANADWGYLSKDKMISQADAIAIITISKIEPSDAGSSYGIPGMAIYSQRGSATVEQLLKGELPKAITIYASYGPRPGLAFACYPTNSLKIGRSLVFLNHDGSLLVPMNADLGVRPIGNDEIDWYGLDAYDRRKRTNISEVVEEIKKQLKEAKPQDKSKK